MSKQARQRLARVAVVFDKKDAQRFCRLSRSLRIHPAFFRALRHRVKRQFKCAAITSAPAIHFNRAAVKIEKVLRDRQTQPEPAKLATQRRISLLERLREGSACSNGRPHFSSRSTSIPIPLSVISNCKRP